MKPVTKYLSFTGNSGCYGALPLEVLAGATTYTIEAKFSTTSTKNVTSTYGGNLEAWKAGTVVGIEIADFGKDDGCLYVNNGKLCFWCSPASAGTATSNTKIVSSSAVVNDGNVHKVAVVSSDGAIDLYCDGANVAHADNINAKFTDAYRLLLAYNTNANSYLQMDLHELRLWNVARTAEEIFADINGTEAGLQGWYLPSEDGLQDYSGNGRHVTLYGNPAYTELETLPVALTMDVERKVKNDAKIINSIKVWLPFDESPTLDKCGNSWTAYGTPTIADGALQLDGQSSYLSLNGGITLGGQDFTIDGWFNLSSSSGNHCRIFSFHNANSTTENCINLARNGTSNNLYTDCMNSTSSNFAVALNENHYFAYVYQHDEGKVKIFIDGKLKLDWSKSIARTTFPNVFIGKSNWDDGYPVGSIDEFQIYDGVALYTENFTPPTSDDYVQLKLALGSSAPLNFISDVERVVKNDAYIQRIAQSLKVWLPFDTSAIEDKLGNEWTTYGTVSIGTDYAISGNALQVNNGYLRSNEAIEFGGTDFTVSFYGYMNSSSEQYAGFFCAQSTTNTGDGGRPGQLSLYRNSSSAQLHIETYNSSGTQTANVNISNESLTNGLHHFELDYSHENSTLKIFVDGALTLTRSITIERLSRYIFLGVNSYNPSQQRMVGSIDEFLLFDGIALHTTNFSPPNAEFYGELAFLFGLTVEFTVDVERKVKNIVPVEFTVDLERILRQTWRYENAGTADTLITTGKTLTNLPESKSVTGTAFYQTAQEKCFDLPATSEVWLKFDVYFNGSTRWRAYNDGTNGTTGITAQTNGAIYFFVNNNEITGIANAATKNQLQTVLLHMTAGSSDGVIEAWVDGTLIYTYIGDVNHGEDFADLYLQSGGSGTFFSNVIISNVEIGFGEGYHLISVDVERRVSTVVEFTVDVERRVKNVVPFEFTVDVEIRDVLPVTFTADVVRNVQRAIEFTADVEILDVVPVEFSIDVARSIVTKIDTYVTDNSEYLQGGGSLPVVIPTPDVIPWQERNGVQSIEITIAEQQITEQVKVTGVIEFDILSAVQGQYLDYVYDMCVERVQQQGMVYSVDCCSDIDALLYTQMAYTLPENWVWQMQWRKAGEEPVTQDIKTYYPPASKHVEKIAAALGLQAVMQFDDFLSTVLMENLGGVTYADLIRDVFGWSSRVPTQLINVYIRGGKLFVIQRGHEANVIDISGTKHTLPIYTRELVRTTWGSSPWSKTETREMQSYQYVPPDTAVDDSGGDSGGDDEKPIREVSTQFNGKNAQGYTTYTYDDAGRLIHTYTYVNQKNPFQNTYTNVDHVYDDDGTMIYTDTSTQSMGQEGESASRHVEEKYYITLPNGEKFLAGEYTATYQNDDGISISDRNLVDSKYTTHSPSRVGQSHTITINGDGDISGSIVGQNTGDDRVTPFASRKARALNQSFETSESSSDSGWKTDTESRTVSGIALYDSSFPIHNEDKLIAITEELKRLNRMTREAVTLSLYDFPHLIDFNDRVILDGAEYFLANNRARSTPRLYNEQNITLVRWY